jgi:hypothetical protein
METTGQQQKKMPNNADIVLTLHKYTSDAADIVSTMPTGVPLYQIRISHPAWPSVTDRFVDGLGAYLRAAHANDDNFPADLQALRQNEDTIVQITYVDPNPDGAPFEPWAPVVYVAGDMEKTNNTLNLLKDYVVYRATHPLPGVDRSPWPRVEALHMHVHPHINIDVADTVNAFERVQKTCHAPAGRLPLSVFGVSPPSGHRVLLADVEVVDDDHVIVAWSGRTYSFRTRFDMLEIPLQDGMRILNEDQRNVGSARTVELIERVFGDGVLRDAVVNVRIDGEPREGTVVHAFVQTLLAKPNLFFDSF